MTDVSLNVLIEDLRRYREDEPELGDLLREVVAEFEYLQSQGWPDSEITYSDSGMPGGIPVEFARIVIILCQYCADHNIDLTDAIERVRN
jgi:hypothetical protein